ncbi:DIL domain-domain-containing protein [Syncephalastrum racemosum]|uniref:DIL domain-domain-containing protein n=1 Tax=Syncephalastrum racemosum TaxID=13706 RepID=A0A1X2H5W0_SYNRA|nr:DIL domain-domain-containing protein [Syncephalastrum racemosum]
MWATNNNQEAVVKVLLEHGASSQQKSAKGRTVFDFVNTDNQKIVEILATNPRDSVSSTSSLFGRYAGSLSSTTSSNAGDCDFYYQSTVEGYDSFMAEEADRRKKLLESAMALAGGEAESEEEGDSEEVDFESDEEPEFHWDKCMPDQMFVFSADNLGHILDTVITDMQLPVKSKQEICVPANVVFLCSRFAHYFSSDELLEQVLEGTLQRVSDEMKNNSRNVHVLAFWITNMTQLLYYLKKDTSLVVATAEYQLRISELISEIYTMIVSDTERRIHKVLGAAILEHEQIPGMEDVNFADDWQRFFRRSSRRSVIVPPDGGLAVQLKQHRHTACHVLSPQSITSLLTSTLYVLQAYEVHPTIIIQALAQFIHYMSCELFNRILTNKKLLCRSKALQIRMNLSLMEEWVRENELPPSLISYFDPTTQLLQMLQCLTQLTDLASFLQTVKKFDALNALQLKRCVINYRYEVNEPRLPEEVEKYVLQLAEDTLRFRQAREPRKRSGSISMARAQTSTGLQRARSRRESVSNFVGSIMSSVGLATSASLPPTMPSAEEEQVEQHEADKEEKHMPQHNCEQNAHVGEITKALGNTRASSDHHEKQEDTEPPPPPSLPASAASAASTADKEAEDVSAADEREEEEEDVEEKEMKETRDSKFMLPFSVPTTVHMVSVNGWTDQNIKAGEQRCVIPIIPDSWMEKLDKDSLE